jgi:hypothetical protein
MSGFRLNIYCNAICFLPYAAPSTGGFGGNSPLGVRQGCRTLPEGQESLPATPVKIEERRK